MIRRLGMIALLAAVPAAAQVSPRADTARRPTAPADTTRAAAAPAAASAIPDTAVTPTADQSRGVDAEMRMALFDLVQDRPLAALNRLSWLSAKQGTQAASAAQAKDLTFLLSQTYYRLGMGDAFRSSALTLADPSGGSRYAPILRTELMLDAYERADYEKAIDYAGTSPVTGDRGLGMLVSGLARYHARDYAAARQAFGQARQAGGIYGAYAQYLDALATIGADTMQAAQALDSLKALSATTTGNFGDQVKLAAAEVAYASGQYEAASTLADNVTAGSGLAPHALMVKAWALYRANKADQAATTFAEFATKYPQLPRRDEARLMAGQLMLEAGKTDEAEHYFQGMADSINAEAAAVQQQANTAMGDAAKALVNARAAGIIFVDDPQAGKTIALPDGAGATPTLLLATFSSPTAAPPDSTVGPKVVTATDIDARLASLGPVVSGMPRRMFYVPLTEHSNISQYATRAEALASADVEGSLARYRLQAAEDAHARKVAVLQQLQAVIGQANSSLDQLAVRLQAMQDSLTQMAPVLDQSRARIRAFIMANVQAARQMAQENQRMADSVQSSLGANAGAAELEILSTEKQTSGYYERLSNTVEAGLDVAIGRHAVLALRDSVGARLAQAKTLQAETKAAIASTGDAITTELNLQQGAESERIKSLKAAQTVAEGKRAAAETQLISLVDAALKERAGSLVTMLKHDVEAAEFGSASASFFRATNAGKGTTPATPSTNQQSNGGSTASAPPAGTPPSSPR